MKQTSVAIIHSDFHDKHSSSWGGEWIACCSEAGITHELIRWRSLGSFEKLYKHDVILWHFSHYSAEEMKFARPILAALRAAGRVVFPDSNDSYHFDDKVAQSYLMRALDIPSPKNYPLHSPEAVEDWIQTVGSFPVVAKLRGGSGSSNVKLIGSAQHLRDYSRTMFQTGFAAHPSPSYKIKSNLASARSFGEIITRLRRAPEFLFSLRNARHLERERGYVYLQEFIPQLSYDLKIVVVGDQLSFIGREVRDGDFRASGGGGLFFNRKLITADVIDSAFAAYDALESDCIGFDVVVDPRSERPLILEISYGFSHSALMQAGGHFDRNHNWHETPLNAPRAVLDRLLRRVRAK